MSTNYCHEEKLMTSDCQLAKKPSGDMRLIWSSTLLLTAVNKLPLFLSDCHSCLKTSLSFRRCLEIEEQGKKKEKLLTLDVVVEGGKSNDEVSVVVVVVGLECVFLLSQHSRTKHSVSGLSARKFGNSFSILQVANLELCFRKISKHEDTESKRKIVCRNWNWKWTV